MRRESNFLLVVSLFSLALNKHENSVEIEQKKKQFRAVVTMDISFNQYFVGPLTRMAQHDMAVVGAKSVENPKTNLIPTR